MYTSLYPLSILPTSLRTTVPGSDSRTWSQSLAIVRTTDVGNGCDPSAVCTNKMLGRKNPESLVWRFLWEENVELMRPLVRDVDKTSKYIRQLARIGFQVSRFVVVREAGWVICGSRRDGT